MLNSETWNLVLLNCWSPGEEGIQIPTPSSPRTSANKLYHIHYQFTEELRGAINALLAAAEVEETELKWHPLNPELDEARCS